MFQAARRQMRTVAMLAVAAALVVAGVAAAQGDSQGGSGGSGKAAGAHPPGPPPAMGLAMKGLTYAELHVQNEDGEAEVVRIDQGKIKTIGEGSITLTANDDSEVTIPVDENTAVMSRPGEESSLDDLEAGQQVSVSRPEGETAKAVIVLPGKGDVAAMMQGAPGPPPPGAEMSLRRFPG